MKKTDRGVTIIEIILYFGLLSIFLVSITSIFTSSLDLRLESEATSNIYQDQRYIFARLNYDISNADSFNLNGNILNVVSSGIVSTYFLDSGRLMLTKDGQTYALNGLETQIENLVFEKIGNVGGKDTLKVVFDISSVIEERVDRTKHFVTTFGLR